MSEFSKCDLTFVCRQTWESLRQVAPSHVRYCDRCNKGVFSVRTRVELEIASAIGRCVTLTDDNEIVGWIGESDFDWMAEESETVAVRSHHPLDTDMVSQLRLAFPKLIVLEKPYLPGTWLVIGSFSPRIAAILEADIRAMFPNLELRERVAAWANR